MFWSFKSKSPCLELAGLNYLNSGLDKACLMVENLDSNKSYDLWVQSQKCIKCPPWKIESLAPEKNIAVIVNSTYPSELFIHESNQDLPIYKYDYHFNQLGIYSLKFNHSKSSNIISIDHGDNENLAVMISFIFFFGLILIRVMINCLRSRMDESTQSAEVTNVQVRSPTAFLYRDESINEFRYDRLDASPSTSRVRNSPPIMTRNRNNLNVIDSRAPRGRLNSLDAFRGLCIVMMVFCNLGGGKYYYFRHSVWNGLTVADFIFPWFMWTMGVSLYISIRSQMRRFKSYPKMISTVFFRSAKLFLLGVMVNGVGDDNFWPTFRLLGVLQRLAFCFLITALLEMVCLKRQDPIEYVEYWSYRDLVWSWLQWFIVLIFAIVHFGLTQFLPVPGCGAGYVGPGGLHDNASYSNCTGGSAMYIDYVILGEEHMYAHPSCKVIYNTHVRLDPEGLLGILNSLITVQFGVAVGRILHYFHQPSQRLGRFLTWGIVTGFVGGLICNWSIEDGPIPINKNLWSLSYVFVTASTAIILFAIFYYTIDMKKIWSGSFLRVVGLNSILIYFGHELLGHTLVFTWSPINATHTSHLISNIWGTSLWVLIAYWCHKRNFYFSV